MSVYIKIHFSEDRKIVAICDKDLLGKTFSKGQRQLVVSESFFKCELVEADADWKAGLDSADSINFVGKEAVSIGCKLGIINKEEIQTIKNIPYALVIKI